MRKRGSVDLIEDVVRQLGISGTYQGMQCLVYAVDLVWQQPELLSAVTKNLYPTVAKKCRSNWRNVERNLRTAVDACWQRGNRSLLNEMAGFPLQTKPTTGELIDYIVHYIRRQEILEEYDPAKEYKS